jgi:hypothetical protein
METAVRSSSAATRVWEQNILLSGGDARWWTKPSRRRKNLKGNLSNRREKKKKEEYKRCDGSHQWSVACANDEVVVYLSHGSSSPHTRFIFLYILKKEKEINKLWFSAGEHCIFLFDFCFPPRFHFFFLLSFNASTLVLRS